MPYRQRRPDSFRRLFGGHLLKENEDLIFIKVIIRASHSFNHEWIGKD
jgi:hypothetical protein